MFKLLHQTHQLRYTRYGDIILNGHALRNGERIKVFAEINGILESKYVMAVRYRTDEYPDGIFVLKGSFYNVPLQKLKARRLLPEEFGKVQRKNLYNSAASQ